MWAEHERLREDANRDLAQAEQREREARAKGEALAEQLTQRDAGAKALENRCDDVSERGGDFDSGEAGDGIDNPTGDGTTMPVPTLEQAERNHAQAELQHQLAVGTLQMRQRDLENVQARLQQALDALHQAIAGSPWADLDALLGARLPASEVARVEAMAGDFALRQGEVAARLHDAGVQAIRLRAEGVLEGDAATRQLEALETLQSVHAAATDRRANVNALLVSDNQARAARQNRLAAIEAARREASRWTTLSGLIGAANGAPFRNFAQGLTLDILARRANRHLARLSERYRIRRVEGDTLDLDIEDLHQAGVRRPMQSLSGGESFLASLALALGLSDLAGRNVRIDSLFIDEGFGTLDPETLEIAIAALDSLRQHNKTIGVISHVELLKERIGTQIVVERQSGGTSRLRVVAAA
jgi:exonuclease SbcC